MIDDHDVREMLHRRADTVPTMAVDTPKAVRRACRRLLVNGAMATVAAVAIVLTTFAGVDAIRSAPGPADRPTPDTAVLRPNGEVLRYTGGRSYPSSGDLVAVNPETGEERVLVENLSNVTSAEWSADGRWVAYERRATDSEATRSTELWVVSATHEPRRLATGGDPGIFSSIGLYWIWSPSGAELATVDRSTLYTIDPVTGETIDLGSFAAVRRANASPMWTWSPNGTQIAFVAPGGAVASVDIRSGERSILARLSGESLDSISQIDWSPEGSRLAVVSTAKSNSTGRLYVMDADGSNVRVLAEDLDARGVAWSPDGTRLAYGEAAPGSGEVRIWVASLDDADPVQIGSVSFGGCTYPYMCGLAWSPDGTRIGFGKADGEDSAFAADAPGPAEPLDDLTYQSWTGGSFPAWG
jgi:Tol biopolymer transport system component